ncbi:hypothetical protein J5N97_017376 [Dioscorea zingiberensis]|uniref:DUF7653 domain-containing protein n=1 Tax=Dioscorea zingiberensis TaxID=325984 RepID=A0A9D5CL28_9LILI|nr:hypothetical protein J5N97_017376 [Dioscorea zingiberensis]
MVSYRNSYTMNRSTVAAFATSRSTHEKVKDSCQSPKDKDYDMRGHQEETEVSSNKHLNRSLSFSYPAIYCPSRGANSNSVNGQSIFLSGCGNSPHEKAECSINSHSLTPERFTRLKRGERPSFRKTHTFEKLDIPADVDGYQYSSGNSHCNSPLPLRCRCTHLVEISSENKFLDLYIDGEHQEMKSKKDNVKHCSDTGVDGFVAENRTLPSLRRSPLSQSTASASPTYGKENLKCYSFREERDIGHQLSMQEWARDDHRLMYPQKFTKENVDKLTSPQKYRKKVVDSLSDAVPGMSLMKSQDYDSENTVTKEDIYDALSDSQPNLNSNFFLEKHPSDFTSSNSEDLNGSSSMELLSFRRKNFLPGNGNIGINSAKLMDSGLQELDIDRELVKKAKEVEGRLVGLSEEELDLDELESGNLNSLSMLQKIQDVMEDRRALAFDLSSQIKCRLAERFSAREHFKHSKVELDTRTRRLEKEKNELQFSLEKELDRRSNEWSLKLVMFRSEEQRLRERVRELAEQNVLLQREISFIKGNEVDTRNRFVNSHIQVNALTVSLEEVRTENNNLQQNLSELQQRFNVALEDLDSVKKIYKEKEKENGDLYKLVVKLQRTCSEQDKTIDGLRQEYNDEIKKQLMQKGDNFNRLQMEHLRLTGVEQMLRRELESCRQELESLRRENVCLLKRFQGSRSNYSHSLLELDQELHAQIECLKTQGLSLLNDNAQFCGELLSFIKHKHCEQCREVNSEFTGYTVVDYTVKHQSLRRGTENLRKNLQTISETLDEKSNQEALECQSQTTEDVSRHLKDQDKWELELKAETKLNRLLRERLFSSELELERLEADFASSVRSRDVLQTEIQRLQDELSCLNHKTKDMELQMLRTDETNNQHQHDLQECMKELTSTRGVLLKVSEERDRLWSEVKHSRETVMLLEHEVISLKKKIEILDEDVLVKEGQISILKDSLGDKSFKINYSPPQLVRELVLE